MHDGKGKIHCSSQGKTFGLMDRKMLGFQATLLHFYIIHMIIKLSKMNEK